MQQRFRQLQLGTMRADEKKTIATATADLEHVPKEHDDKYKDQGHGKYSSRPTASDLRGNAE